MKLKKAIKWQMVFASLLLLASASVYFLHYKLFHDAHHIFIYMVGDVAFVPVEVLLVTLILHRVLENREKKHMLRKLNMVIGAFFSEVGNPLIRTTTDGVRNFDSIRTIVDVKNGWNDSDFKQAEVCLNRFSPTIEADSEIFKKTQHLLVEKRPFLLGLLENANLLEHEHFTDLLWSVFHLTEELESRKDYKNNTARDKEHLNNDLKRVYERILVQWLMYMIHLKHDYPYLYSLAMRKNPFFSDRQAEIA